MFPTRAAVAIVATALAIVLLFSFKTPALSKTHTPAADVSQGGATPSPSPTDSSAPSPSPSVGSGLKDGVYTGQDVLTQFGDVQVKVTISGGQITDVQAVQMPYEKQRSAEISQFAAPRLHDEVLQAQSAQIDTLSGATYTSEAYAQSVQSALDQAHG
jgi:uncharacterized protein with FMN-binding domain